MTEQLSQEMRARRIKVEEILTRRFDTYDGINPLYFREAADEILNFLTDEPKSKYQITREMLAEFYEAWWYELGNDHDPTTKDVWYWLDQQEK